MSAPIPPIGRNATCPCGSGRRFKSCCGSNALPPASAAAEALAQKLRRALALQQSGSVAEAVAAYRGVLQHEPDLADAVHMLGVTHLQAGNYPEAARQLHQAAELFNWELPAVRHNLGLALAALLSGSNGTQVARLWQAYDRWRDRRAAERRDIDPCVSVVVVGDRSGSIEAALESVFRQSYARIEVVVVDGGAAEPSTPTLNAAVARSTGEFVNVLLGADGFAATRVEAMVDAIARTGAAWGFSRAILVESDGAEALEASIRAAELRYVADDVAACDTVGVSLLPGNPVISASALFFSRELFDQLEGFRGDPVCYDWDFCLRASIVAEPVYVASAEYEHRLQAGGAVQAEAAALRAAEATVAAFYDAAMAEREPANPFAPVPAVWGDRFFAQMLGRGHAASLPTAILRDLSARVAASRCAYWR